MFFLQGIRVVDLTTMIQGPDCTLLFGDLGADVIKVEPLGGEPYRNVTGDFLSLNAGKRSLAIDLKQQAGKEILLRLVLTADIFMQNLRPGTIEKLGFDYASLTKVKPDIVYLSMYGWGTQGSNRARPSYDVIFQAQSGHMVAQGGPHSPAYLRIAMNDYAAGMLGAFGAALAMIARAKDGVGQCVESGLLGASTLLQSGDFVDWHGMKRKYVGAPGIKGLSAANRLYKAGDGKWLLVFCAREPHWRSLCRVLHQESLCSDPRFAAADDRTRNDAALVELLEDAFRQQPAAHWIAALRDAGVPVGPAQTHDELLQDPHCIETHVFMSQDHPLWGPTRIVGVTPRFSQMPTRARTVAPELGEHTDELLTELGYGSEQIAELMRAKVVSSPSRRDL